MNRSYLNHVGMSGIETQILWQNPNQKLLTLPARCSAFVDLEDPRARGIHMSRLYLELFNRLKNSELTFSTIQGLLKQFQSSHEDLSKQAHLKVNFDIPLERKALVSDNIGMRIYPFAFEGTLSDNQTFFQLILKISYSSTCPCSSNLARSLLIEELRKNFPQQVSMQELADWLTQEKNTIATAHCQRSLATVKIVFKNSSSFDNVKIIKTLDDLEKSLGTPVQSAVKRPDEQEFARLNGNNLMFCEDAARKVVSVLDLMKEVEGYWVSCEHFESLHPHDAVSVVHRGYDEFFRLFNILY